MSTEAPAPAAPVEAPPADAPATPPAPPPKPAAPVTDLVRVAKAERKAAQAIKAAESQTAALAEVQGKQTRFNEHVAKGELLDAAKIYFPDDGVLADKLFWQLTDYVANREEPKEPTVDEKIAKALDAKAEAEKKAAAEKAAHAKKAEGEAADRDLANKRVAYFAETRKILASDHGAYPLVTAKILSGDITPDEIVSHVEAIGEDIFKLGLSEADLVARIREETSPAAIVAALEQVLRQEAGLGSAGEQSADTSETIDQITERAIAHALRRGPPSTISSAAIQGAPPVVQKRPEEMSSDELNDWAIAEAMKKHGTAAAR